MMHLSQQESQLAEKGFLALGIFRGLELQEGLLKIVSHVAELACRHTKSILRRAAGGAYQVDAVDRAGR